MRQKGEMKQVPYRGPTHIMRHLTKFSLHGEPGVRDVCARQIQQFRLQMKQLINSNGVVCNHTRISTSQYVNVKAAACFDLFRQFITREVGQHTVA
jgi:hypothetical protein